MTLLLIVLVLLVGGVAAHLIRRSGEPLATRDIDPEQAMKAAVELHRIRRRLDVARTRSEQRSASARVRREISEALKAEEK